MRDAPFTPENYELELPQEVRIDSIGSANNVEDFHPEIETTNGIDDIINTSPMAVEPEAIVEVPVPDNSEGLNIPEAPLGFGAVTIAGVAIAARIKKRHELTRHKRNNSRNARNRQRNQESDQLSLGAQEELERHESQTRKDLADSYGVRDSYPRSPDPAYMPEFDYIEAFSKTHMQRRLKDPINPKSFKPSPATTAHNHSQESAHIKASLRADARRVRVGEIDKLRTLYGDIISAPEEELEAYIEENDFTKKYTKSLRRAGGVVRRRQNSARRIDNRLARQANGDDIPGRITRIKRRIRR